MADAGPLLDELRAIARGCGSAASPAEGLPAGFQNVGDVILLLQPMRLAAEDADEALRSTLERLAEKSFLTGTQTIARGGLWAALVGGCAAHARGFHTELSESEGATASDALLAERSSCVLVSTRPKAHVPLANFVERRGRFTAEAIGRVTAGEVRVRWMDQTVLEVPSMEALTR